MCCCLSLSLRLQETVFLVDHVWQIHGRTIRVSELAIYCTINRICENAIIWIVLHYICLQSTLLWMHCHYFFLFGGWIETRPNKCVVLIWPLSMHLGKCIKCITNCHMHDLLSKYSYNVLNESSPNYCALFSSGSLGWTGYWANVSSWWQ